jgi:hypothetical protein
MICVLPLIWEHDLGGSRPETRDQTRPTHPETSDQRPEQTHAPDPRTPEPTPDPRTRPQDQTRPDTRRPETRPRHTSSTPDQTHAQQRPDPGAPETRPTHTRDQTRPTHQTRPHPTLPYGGENRSENRAENTGDRTGGRTGDRTGQDRRQDRTGDRTGQGRSCKVAFIIEPMRTENASTQSGSEVHLKTLTFHLPCETNNFGVEVGWPRTVPPLPLRQTASPGWAGSQGCGRGAPPEVDWLGGTGTRLP